MHAVPRDPCPHSGPLRFGRRLDGRFLGFAFLALLQAGVTGLGKFRLELLNPAGRIDKLLLTRIERVAR